MRYDVNFHTYSGMRIPIAENVDRDEAAAAVKRKNQAARRRGQPISKLGKNRWEHETPEDAFMISDYDGILSVTRRKRR